MDSSSGSDSYYDRERARRPRGREAQRRPARESRANGGGGGHRLVNGIPGSAAAGSAGISEKISTLASTLQDTSRNLNKVDKMLGQYREHTDDQAEAMAMLKENLEESIGQLQSQRHRRPSQSRSHRTHSASASTLHTSDLEAGSASGSGPEGPRFIPTSHLKDYSGTESAPPIRRRSLSAATVRFSDPCPVHPEANVRRLHQSLRDLCSDQMRLSDDLDREIVRRNRSEIETRRAMESLSQHLSPPPKQDSVSSRVERRLQDLEREMAATERQSVLMSEERLEALGRQQTQERDEVVKARLLRSEQEKTKMEQELDRTRRLLEQTKDSRESLEQQVEDMRGELLRTGKETAELRRSQQDLQREISQLSAPPPRPPYADREDRGRPGVGPDRSDLEREVAELRGELRKASVLGEVDELKRTLERSEKERIQLCTRLEELTSDLTRREQQQLRMLEQLKDIQGRGQAERSDTEALLQESTRSREELKSRAQEAVRQWRAKCRRLQKELDEARTQAQEHTDKASQVSRDRESSQAHLKSLSQQSEASRRELTEVLGRLAQREDEVHRKDVELSETRQRHLSLEQEIREVRDASAALEQEAQRQTVLQARLREENHRLEEQAVLQAQLREENRRLEEQAARRSLRDHEAQAELQAAVKELTAARATLARQLAAEESSGKELQRAASELRVKLGTAQEERASVLQQLQLEREVHQKELDNLRAAADDDRAKRDRELQETLRLCRQEREEMQAVVTEAKVDVASEKELCRALRVKVDRMKEQCDKLSQELLAKEEAHSLLQRRHQLLQQDLDDKAASGEERRRGAEAECGVLEERLSRLGAEREALLASVGEELDVACRSLARGSEDKLQAISQKPGLVKEPPCWLAETKTKLRWLCEEVRERETRERRLRKQQQQQTRDQLKALRESRDSEQSVLLQRLDRQEKLLHSLSADKKELLERSRRKEEEVRILQDRILDLEMSTRLALDHLESVPEKLCLMEDFKDLEESQRQRELVQQRYAKYKEIVCDLQHQLDESKRKMQEYRDEKLDATSRSLRLAALSSSIKGPGAFLSTSHRSHALSPQKCPSSSDVDISTVNGAMTPSDHLSLK